MARTGDWETEGEVVSRDFCCCCAWCFVGSGGFVVATDLCCCCCCRVGVRAREGEGLIEGEGECNETFFTTGGGELKKEEGGRF